MSRFQTWIRIRRRFVVGFVIFLFFLALIFARTFFVRSLQFVQKELVASATWITNKTSRLAGSCDVQQKAYQEALDQRNQYAIDKVQMDLLKAENENLTKELNFLQRRTFRGVSASIIARTASDQTSTFMINAGKTNGVVEGAAVIVGDGVYVGKITRVDETQSIVSAPTDIRSETGVSLLNKTRTIGIAQGSNGNLIELKFIPADEEIHPNDLVVTSGLEDRVPSGLLVGIVNATSVDQEAPFQHAIVEPLVDVRRYDHVIVLLPSV